MPDLKAELSKKSRYYVNKHRYYELKHFCLQYPDWKREYQSLEIRISRSYEHETVVQNGLERPVEDLAERRERLLDKIKMVERAATLADECIGKWLLKAVTEDIAFTKMKMVHEVPCEKDMWYDRYRKFFWLLDGLRG